MTPMDPLAARSSGAVAKLPARPVADDVSRYDAFICYNRTADTALAHALRRRMLRLGMRWWRRSPRRIYLSHRSIDTPTLPVSVQDALRSASHLVLLAASRLGDHDHGSAGSRYMRQEVGFWLEHCGGTADRLLIVHTRGGNLREALPWMSPLVVSRCAVCVDVRPAGNDGREIRSRRFDTPITRLVAAL